MFNEEQVSELKELIKQMFKDDTIKIRTTLERDFPFHKEKLTMKVGIFIDDECAQKEQSVEYLD